MKRHIEHHLLLKTTFLIPPFENLLYLFLLVFSNSTRDYLLSPVFLLMIFCTLETYLLTRFLGMCIFQKIAIWNPLFGPFVFWITPIKMNDIIVLGIIIETILLLLLLFIREDIRIKKGKSVLCATAVSNKIAIHNGIDKR